MGSSASVTPKAAELAVTRPDIDVEICPPGTMAAMRALEAKLRLIHDDDAYRAVWRVSQARLGPYRGPKYEEELDRVTAILTAHREKIGRLGIEADTSPVVSRESRQATDYTSETEDLITWPQTRGPKWRRMERLERLQKGDVRMTRSGYGYVFARHTIGSLVGNLDSKEAWTRRPAPEAQT